MSTPDPNREASLKQLALLSLSSLFLCGFILLFILYNGQWIPIYIPGFPWSQKTVAFAFETTLNTAMPVAFTVGIILTSLFWHMIKKDKDRELSDLKIQIASIKQELKQTQQLIELSQTKQFK